MFSLYFLFFPALIVSWLVTYPIVWALKFFHVQQAIRAEGPQSHQSKAGTPTMGGVGFILVILAISLIVINIEFDLRYLAFIAMTLGFALVGLADDWLKVTRKKNLGLTFWQKIIAQTFFAALFCGALVYVGHQQTVGGYLKMFWFTDPTLYFLLSTFIVVGTANATNLTDGLNGLLAGTGGIAFLAFAILARQYLALDAATFCFIASGAVLAFLYFNFPKAQVFMGDVGSLAIGAALAGIALIIHKELRLAIIGGVFVLEALSVISQVTIYKLFKKRLFKMSPLHHHFELMGIPEIWVVVGFWVVGIGVGIVGVLW